MKTFEQNRITNFQIAETLKNIKIPESGLSILPKDFDNTINNNMNINNQYGFADTQTINIWSNQ